MFSGKLIGIRALEYEDLPLLTRLANDPRVRRGVTGWAWPLSPVGQREWLQTAVLDPVNRRLAVFDLATDATVGMTGLWDVDWRNRSATVGIKLDLDAAPPGTGTEVMQLLAAVAFLEMGLNRINGPILADNIASQRMVQKAGFQLEGTQREALFSAGEARDVKMYAFLRSDFEQQPWAAEYAGYILPPGSDG